MVCSSALKKLSSSEDLLHTWKQWRCCIHGSRVIKMNSKKFLFFHKVDIVYNVRVVSDTRRWVVPFTFNDFRHLHEELMKIAHNNKQFQDAITNFPLPREHLFNRRDMLVIKGMCGTLEHYLVNVLRYCQKMTGDDMEQMAKVLQNYLGPPQCTSDPLSRHTRNALIAKTKLI
ncbi:hypothetical protein THRCLA_07555 [Thraustotheca clavata]|uniref:PX domain-containing protein n=1 Tax=Thraustotheca clavata TaxID=74557 RepID=A0A1V9ZCU3_9STRA|nr:hypothetical protein THRCLA_07555 [Thraustotheca clavata]